MKKVIDGKLYNTETADLIHDWNNGCFASDFNRCSESLYRTKKGNFFLYGKGGARSKYGKCFGNNSVGGSDGFTVLATVEARLWMESHDGDADVIIKLFDIEDA